MPTQATPATRSTNTPAIDQPTMRRVRFARRRLWLLPRPLPRLPRSDPRELDEGPPPERLDEDREPDRPEDERLLERPEDELLVLRLDEPLRR
jgi:hypothetical protein